MSDAPTSSPFRSLEIGQIVRPAEGESASGDAVLVQRVGASVLVAVADALGHGEAASSAATACIVAIQKHVQLPLEELFPAVNESLRGGRGAVAAVARLDPGARTVTLAALGNIGVVLLRGGRGGSPSCGNHRATCSAAHAGVRSRWQSLHAFGVPSATVRSGRGERNEWSWRGAPRADFRSIMWQSVQREPGVPGAWKWCSLVA